MPSGPVVMVVPEDCQPRLTREQIAAIVETVEVDGVNEIGQALFPDETTMPIEAGVAALSPLLSNQAP